MCHIWDKFPAFDPQAQHVWPPTSWDLLFKVISILGNTDALGTRSIQLAPTGDPQGKLPRIPQIWRVKVGSHWLTDWHTHVRVVVMMMMMMMTTTATYLRTDLENLCKYGWYWFWWSCNAQKCPTSIDSPQSIQQIRTWAKLANPTGGQEAKSWLLPHVHWQLAV